MRIQWNSDAAESIIRQLADAESELSACRGDADRVRNALTDANPDRDDRRLNTITERFEAAMARLERIRDELNETMRDARRANESFLEAENRNLRLVARLEEGHEADEGARPTIIRTPAPATVPTEPWQVHIPKVMPANYAGWTVEIPGWLNELLGDYRIEDRI
ncbi:MAG: hypothetical protein IJC56_07520 [Clostridia bacterium]|nr:hypothetical protein [Clostridia bacterium]